MRASFSPGNPLRSRETWRSMLAGTHILVGNQGELQPVSQHGAVVVNPLNQISFFPLVTGRGGILTAIMFEVTVAGAAGSVGRVGLYRGDSGVPPASAPGTLIFDGGQKDCTVIGLKSTAMPNIVMPPDECWWIATLFGTAAPTIRTVDAGAMMGYQGTVDVNVLRLGLLRAFAFAALPNPAGAPGGFILNNGTIPTTYAAGVQVI